MGGLFGAISKEDCIQDLFYGTDYHSHLGTRRGGMALKGKGKYHRVIHNIENAQFRSKFEDELLRMSGNQGVGCISDTEDQPLLIGSHLGTYAIVTVGRINNLDALANEAFGKRIAHFSEMSDGEINPTELVATLINEGATFQEGIQRAQEAIDGSCSLLLSTDSGLYAARDRYGRTPIILGMKDGALCISMESCAFPNLDYNFEYELGPGEIVRVTQEGHEQLVQPHQTMRMCSFLWVYYGYPASSYEGMNVEVMRNRSGRSLAKNDNVDVDIVAGIPDSGTAHAIGYANEAKVPYCRPFIKYTPTWPRSFMPQVQSIRDLVARMKLIPINDLIQNQRLLFCEDSIVRGTQLQDTIRRIYAFGAKEVHMRPDCPPLILGCKFLNFSRSRSELDLAGRRAIRDLEGDKEVDLHPYSDCESDKFNAMVENIRERLALTSLRYQKLQDMIEAIGLPEENLCTYCWNGIG